MASEKGLRKAPHLTAEQKEQRRLSRQMGDIEFQMAIAPYFDYKAPIDPSIARYQGIKGLSGDRSLTLGGYYIPPENSKRPYTKKDLEPYTGTINNKEVAFPLEPGTVNAVHSKSTPNIWAHEYRHQMKEDGGGEQYNRLADAITAQTDKDWTAAVGMWGDKNQNLKPSEYESDLLKQLSMNAEVTPRKVYGNDHARGARRPGTAPGVLQRPEAKYVQERIDKSLWKKKERTMQDFDKWNKGIPTRNNQRKVLSFITDSLREKP